MIKLSQEVFIMASKGQKFIKYSEEIKEVILSKYLKREGTPTTLGKEYSIPIKTIKNWITKMNKGKNVLLDLRKFNKGRTKEANIDYKERYEILKKYQAFIEARHKIK